MRYTLCQQRFSISSPYLTKVAEPKVNQVLEDDTANSGQARVCLSFPFSSCVSCQTLQSLLVSIYAHAAVGQSHLHFYKNTQTHTHPYFCFIVLSVTFPHCLGESNDGPGINAGETWQPRVRPEERQRCVYGPTLL